MVKQFIKDRVVVSRPGSLITVTQLILTEEGKSAITTGIAGPIPGLEKESILKELLRKFFLLFKWRKYE